MIGKSALRSMPPSSGMANTLGDADLKVVPPPPPHPPLSPPPLSLSPPHLPTPSTFNCVPGLLPRAVPPGLPAPRQRVRVPPLTTALLFRIKRLSPCSYDSQLLPEARDSFHRLLRSLSIATRLWRSRYSSVCAHPPPSTLHPTPYTHTLNPKP